MKHYTSYKEVLEKIVFPHVQIQEGLKRSYVLNVKKAFCHVFPHVQIQEGLKLDAFAGVDSVPSVFPHVQIQEGLKPAQK